MSYWQPYLPYNALACRYCEIGTKGRNRATFERHLRESLERLLSPVFPQLKFLYDHGRIFITFGAGATLSREQHDFLRRQIPSLPGVASLSPGFLVETTPEALHEVLSSSFPAVLPAFLAAFPEERDRTYTMRVNRANKRFPVRSADLERDYARELLPGSGLKIDLNHGKLRIDVDIRYEHVFVDYERIEGPGGLPVGSGGGVLALLSGGFDSPVACYEMMRRGCHVDFVTFHSSPYTPPATLTKVCGLVRQLNAFQKRGRLVAVNLLPVQKAIRDNCTEKNRTVLYRRSMMRLAAHVARHFGDEALVTGDNLGQVASQTLRNLDIIGRATRMLILRPLLTFDKLEIIARADRIGTRALSAEQVPDSCTVFAPSNPSTRAQLFAVEADEARLDLPALLRQCLEGTVMMNPATFDEYGFPELLGRPIDDLGKP